MADTEVRVRVTGDLSDFNQKMKGLEGSLKRVSSQGFAFPQINTGSLIALRVEMSKLEAQAVGLRRALINAEPFSAKADAMKADLQGIEQRIKLLGDAAENTFARRMIRGMEAASAKMKTLGRNLMIGVTLPIIALGTAATKSAMDAVESENLFEVSMGNMADSARKWSEELRNQLGLNAYEVRKTIGTFNVMLTSMGLSEDAAFGMSKGLTKLAYDMASFYNLKPEEAFQKLQSGISGEIEPLKRLGIIVNEATTQHYAYAHGITAFGETLTEQQKVLARYGVIMEQTSKAQGDLARTIDSPTNKLRIMKEKFNEISIEVGMKLIPILEKLMSKLSSLLDWWNKLSPKTQELYLKLAAIAAIAGPVVYGLGTIINAVANLGKGVIWLVGSLGKLIPLLTKLSALKALLNPYALAAAAGVGIAYAGAALADKMAGRRPASKAGEEAFRRDSSIAAKRGQPTYRSVAVEMGFIKSESEYDKWIESANRDQKNKLRDEFESRYNTYLQPKKQIAPTAPTVNFEAIAAAEEDKKAAQERLRDIEKRNADEITRLKMERNDLIAGAKGSEEKRAIWADYSDQIMKAEADAAKERADLTKKINKDEADARMESMANILDMQGRTYDAQRVMAYKSLYDEMSGLQELGLTAEQTRERMYAATSKYYADVKKIADTEAEANRQREVQSLQEAESKENTRLTFFEAIAAKMIEITQGENAAKLYALEQQRANDKKTASSIANSASELAALNSAIDANIDSQRQKLHDNEMKRILDEQNAKVGWVGIRQIWENAMVAGAKLTSLPGSESPVSAGSANNQETLTEIQKLSTISQQQLDILQQQLDLFRNGGLAATYG